MNSKTGRALFLHSLNLTRNTDSQANNLRKRYDSNLRQNPQDRQTDVLQAQNAQLKAEIARLKAQKK